MYHLRCFYLFDADSDASVITTQSTMAKSRTEFWGVAPHLERWVLSEEKTFVAPPLNHGRWRWGVVVMLWVKRHSSVYFFVFFFLGGGGFLPWLWCTAPEDAAHSATGRTWWGVATRRWRCRCVSGKRAPCRASPGSRLRTPTRPPCAAAGQSTDHPLPECPPRSTGALIARTWSDWRPGKHTMGKSVKYWPNEQTSVLISQTQLYNCFDGGKNCAVARIRNDFSHCVALFCFLLLPQGFLERWIFNHQPRSCDMNIPGATSHRNASWACFGAWSPGCGNMPTVPGQVPSFWPNSTLTGREPRFSFSLLRQCKWKWYFFCLPEIILQLIMSSLWVFCRQHDDSLHR